MTSGRVDCLIWLGVISSSTTQSGKDSLSILNNKQCTRENFSITIIILNLKSGRYKLNIESWEKKYPKSYQHRSNSSASYIKGICRVYQHRSNSSSSYIKGSNLHRLMLIYLISILSSISSLFDSDWKFFVILKFLH